ncbi:MAG: hypothetical protein QUS12_09620, partial [Methanosarcina sp.]|nr:hypothetical protein [Methanosarcina sp.]
SYMSFDDVLFHGFIAVFMMEAYCSAFFSGGTCESVYFFLNLGIGSFSLPYGGLKMAFLFMWIFPVFVRRSYGF